MAGFEVIMYGWIWVIPEGSVGRSKLSGAQLSGTQLSGAQLDLQNSRN
jgi:hypothetical protein